MPPMQGVRVGIYTLGEQLGKSGGMGSVWQAFDVSGRELALKLMHSHAAQDGDLVRRFRQEYEIGRRFNHPNLVRMVDQGTFDGVPYLVMELAAGKTVRRLLERGGTFREGEVARFIGDAASGLSALHGGGIIHRDLSATNLMVDRDLSAKIIDYGIARQIGREQLTQPGGFMGKAEYSAPELYLGRQVGPPADIYALGILAFESLTGHVPFRAGRYVDVLRMQAERPAPSLTAELPVISDQIDGLVRAMMEKSPAKRPAAADVARACRLISGRASAPAQRPRERTPRVMAPATASPQDRTMLRKSTAPLRQQTSQPRPPASAPNQGALIALLAVAGVAIAGVAATIISAIALGG